MPNTPPAPGSVEAEALAKWAADMAATYRGWLKSPGDTSSSIVEKWREDVVRYEAVAALAALQSPEPEARHPASVRLRALVERWRAEADHIDNVLALGADPTKLNDSGTYRQCATELEAALAAMEGKDGN